ncbi:caspase family protein [Rhodocyclus purpureus]|uniref:caspase family protein n=1 Tax=Rhodocyclus purpureus TaxID=1067 RepID=UPI001914647F|nr:caspase family protein [Rhodocyclus purpureus]MBK5915008.1 hypothetical protein [Rhodocyclus purpureus]
MNKRKFLALASAGMLLGLLPECHAADAEAHQPSSTGNGFVGGEKQARLALLIANADYPRDQRIFPARKNAFDLERRLRQVGFDDVSILLDADRPSILAGVEKLRALATGYPAASAPMVLVYFCGHGFQRQGQNLLVPARLDLSDQDIVEKSVALQDEVINRLPQHYPGLSVVIVDACRSAMGESRAETFNYTDAPVGCMVAFSASAGQVSLAPRDESQNTFYTAALLQSIDEANEFTPISDVFVKAQLRTQSVMENHPLAFVRARAQRPHLATGQVGRFAIVKTSQAERAHARENVSDTELADWRAVEIALFPDEVERAASGMLRAHPASVFRSQAEVALSGARDARKALFDRNVFLRLSGIRIEAGDARYREDLRKALRGEKDAAARIGAMYRDGSNELERNLDRWEQWLQYAAALGNALSCAELYRKYRDERLDGAATYYRQLATRLGLTWPGELGADRSGIR